MKVIDVRGKQCPIPLLETKKAIDSGEDNCFEILADNEIAVQNLLKMAKHIKADAVSEKIDDFNYKVIFNV